MLQSLFGKTQIPHYYGNSVRELFIVVALLFLITAPFSEALLPIGGVYSSYTHVVIALLLVLLAGLTNPRSMVSLVLDFAAALLGAFFLETAAISLYQSDSLAIFLAREAAAILFLFALYFSVKTLRAMIVGSIGGYRPVLSKRDEDHVRG